MNKQLRQQQRLQQKPFFPRSQDCFQSVRSLSQLRCRVSPMLNPLRLHWMRLNENQHRGEKQASSKSRRTHLPHQKLNAGFYCSCQKARGAVGQQRVKKSCMNAEKIQFCSPCKADLSKMKWEQEQKNCKRSSSECGPAMVFYFLQPGKGSCVNALLPRNKTMNQQDNDNLWGPRSGQIQHMSTNTGAEAFLH